MSHRFFVSPECIREGRVDVGSELAHQWRDVLRLSAGDTVVILDGAGQRHEAVIESLSRSAASCRITLSSPCEGEPAARVILYQGMLKGSKFDYVLQKGTEVGITGFVPMATERTVALPRESGPGPREERWRRILRESSEQCGRGIVPSLAPSVSLAEACRSLGGRSVILWENASDARPLRGVIEGPEWSNPGRVNLLVGPEGGFGEAEVALARDCGAVAANLGRRILRAETAGVVAAALVLFRSGDLG